MSRTKGHGPSQIPKHYKRTYRRLKKAADKQAFQRGVEPERDRRSDAWSYF